ncbi:MAG: helix-turn-helix domain-containing protein [Methylophilus sp.]|nr:helix-turn-helix domain-containing protein [Methylophilus sp.]
MSGHTLALSSKINVVEKGLKLSTSDYSVYERRDWLQEMICQEYTRVEVTPPADGSLFNETTFYNWESLRLSVIKSHGLTIEKLAREPCYHSQDNYLAVVLLSGQYLLEQSGREVFLEPGDMTIYDATIPHRIHSSIGFNKLIVSIPRAVMRDRIAGVEHCTALQVSGKTGVGAVATQLIQSTASQVEYMRAGEFSALSEQSLDLLTLALTTVRPQNFYLSRSRSLSLRLVKDFIERHLADSSLDTAMIATGTHLSPRYINDLFSDENTSLMRYVWMRRIERCHRDIISMPSHHVSAIAFKWGFNNMSHFSRAFKQKFGVPPSALRPSIM